MAETQYIYSYKELVEILVKHQNIHEGIWGLYIKFGLNALNIGPNRIEIMPAAIVPVVELGIQIFKEENNLTVDASKVNPLIEE